jgi:hypothetical protein
VAREDAIEFGSVTAEPHSSVVTGATPSVLVNVYCGYFVGAPHWHGTEVYEPDECDWEADVRVDADEWAEGCAVVPCGRCGALLHQGDGHLEPVR